jgi:hypothetical protein
LKQITSYKIIHQIISAIAGKKQKYANKLEPFNGRKARNCNLLKVVMKWKRFYFAEFAQASRTII